MSKILILSWLDPARDSRLNKQIKLLSQSHQVVAVGTGAGDIAEVDYRVITAPRRLLATKLRDALTLLSRRYASFYWRQQVVNQALAAIRPDERFDLVICHDLDTVPLALRLALGTPVIVDAHEYAPLEFEDRLLWRVVFGGYKMWLCAVFLPKVAHLIAVSARIVEEYRAQFGVPSSLLINAPAWRDETPSPVGQAGVLRLVHHGAAIPSRQLETMILAMDKVPAGYSLDLMLVEAGHPDYLAKLKGMTDGRKNVRIVPPVAMQDIVRTVNGYDAGLLYIAPTNFNYLHCMPNKLLECVQGRLGVVIGPNPEMKRVVEQYDIGTVADDFTAEALARAITRLDRDNAERFKANADRAAAELCFERVSGLLTQVVDSALATASGD